MFAFEFKTERSWFIEGVGYLSIDEEIARLFL